MNQQIQELEGLLESVRRVIRERDDAWATVARLERENGELLDELHEAKRAAGGRSPALDRMVDRSLAELDAALDALRALPFDPRISAVLPLIGGASSVFRSVTDKHPKKTEAEGL